MVRLVVLLVGQAGIRLDRSPWRLLAVPFIVTMWFASRWAVEAGHGLKVTGAAWAFYYVGNTIMLVGPLRRRLIGSLGERRAHTFYEVVVGLMFWSQGLGLGAAAMSGVETFSLPFGLGTPLAVVLFATGFVVKLWSTYVAGLDIYYYQDMFLGRATGEFIASGPYKWLSNPMYGVGNLHSYASAIAAGSLPGMVAALVYHASIYTFYFCLELPFVRRTYLAPSDA
ncbi:MAG: methyltransferase [Myxococcota bacterium]